MTHHKRFMILVALVVVLMVSVEKLVEAVAITVDTYVDELNSDGDCSLREAIQAANTNASVDACAAGSGDDVVTLSAGTYSLSIEGKSEDSNATGDLDILENLTLQGADVDTTIIDAHIIDRVLDIHASSTVTINDLTITGGKPERGDSGGGIRNTGSLTTNRVAIKGNSVAYFEPDSDGSGGGIFSNGASVTLNQTAVISNAAVGGAGIHSFPGDVVLNQSLVSDNRASGWASSGLYGGIFFFGTLTVTNSTISDNFALEIAGGIGGEGTTTISHSTISGNQTGGGEASQSVQLEGGFPLIIKNTIIGGIFGVPIFSPQFCGQLGWKSGGYNLISKLMAPPIGCPFPATSTDQFHEFGNGLELITATGLDPMLGLLQDNGGPTMTLTLLEGSPAIDAGTCTDIEGGTVATDQRGVLRPQGSLCDTGAFELNVNPMLPSMSTWSMVGLAVALTVLVSIRLWRLELKSNTPR